MYLCEQMYTCMDVNVYILSDYYGNKYTQQYVDQ